VNLGKTILEGDVDEKWISVEIAAKEYDQIILDLIHREISGEYHVTTMTHFM
jgi:hypothetical protein